MSIQPTRIFKQEHHLVVFVTWEHYLHNYKRKEKRKEKKKEKRKRKKREYHLLAFLIQEHRLLYFLKEVARFLKIFEDVPLVEFMYLVFTRSPGESYRWRLRSLLLYLCYIFRALIDSLVSCFTKPVLSKQDRRDLNIDLRLWILFQMPR